MLLVLAAGFASAAPGAIGQTEPPVDEGEGGALPQSDAYGNPQHFLPERRSLGIYRNDAEQSYLYSYPLAGYRSPNRGSFMPFSLTGDLLSLPQWMGPAQLQPMQRDRILTPPARREAFSRYGGFGTRATGKSESAVYDALGRRQKLISATSLNSPVLRALLGGGSSVSTGGGGASQVAQTPFVRTEEKAAVEVDSTTTLESRLMETAKSAHDRATAEGWAAFTDGAYRRAAREFATAYAMDPKDRDARVGEIFCYVSLDATHSGVAALNELNKEDESPFTSNLDMTGRYRPDLAKLLRTSAISRVNARSTSADVAALYTFVLWYFGLADDAILSARSLAKLDPAYRNWPAQMEAARGKRNVLPPNSTP